MNVHLEVPDEFARRLASDSDGLARVALEALAAEGVRSGKLSVFQARTLLGIRSRHEMDGFLKAHGVIELNERLTAHEVPPTLASWNCTLHRSGSRLRPTPTV
jgi:Uncharacterised protein family (UPF0175)